MHVTATVGLPASGKSTWAAEQAAADDNIVVVTKDDLRVELHGPKSWTPKRERATVQLQRERIRQAVADGHDVIVADTNLNPSTLESVRRLAGELFATFSVQDFTDVSLATCIERDNIRAGGVGERVIRTMHAKFIAPDDTYTPPAGAPPAIIVDIDGTLAQMQSRRPYDWNQVGSDTVVPHVRDLVRRYSNDHHVLVFSGRDSVCYNETYMWLIDNDIPFWKLAMRAQNDNRNDSIVKRELFDKHARSLNVQLVIDDRESVVQTWLSMGLPVLQVRHQGVHPDF